MREPFLKAFEGSKPERQHIAPSQRVNTFAPNIPHWASCLEPTPPPPSSALYLLPLCAVFAACSRDCRAPRPACGTVLGALLMLVAVVLPLSYMMFRTKKTPPRDPDPTSRRRWAFPGQTLPLHSLTVAAAPCRWVLGLSQLQECTLP